MPNKQNSTKIFVVSGPSGSGKTTLIKHLKSKKFFRNNIVKITTVTTRKRRRGERQDRDYKFVSKEEFLRLRRKAQFVESQEVFDQYYGVPKSDLLAALKKGKDAFLCIDVKGALCIRRIFAKNSVLIFIAAPDIRSLSRRLRLRSTEKKEDLAQRLKLAKQEMGRIKYYDYVIINNKLSQALNQLSAIIKAERLKAQERRKG